MTRRGIRRRYNPGSPVPGQRMDSAVQPAVAPPPGLDAILELAREDMASVDALIRRRLASDVVLVNQVAEYIVNAGGKRLRPMLLLLAAGALSDRGGRGGGARLAEQELLDRTGDPARALGRRAVGQRDEHVAVG